MEFFHFMHGFLSSGTLGFHCTKNISYELPNRNRFIIPTTSRPSVVENNEKQIKVKTKKIPPSAENDIRVMMQNKGEGLTAYDILKNHGLIKGFEVI